MDRRRRVVTSLHNSGMSYAKIGIFLGISRQRAHQLVTQPVYKPSNKSSKVDPLPLTGLYIWLSGRIEEAKKSGLPTQYRYALEDTKKVLLTQEPLLTLVRPDQ